MKFFLYSLLGCFGNFLIVSSVVRESENIRKCPCPNSDRYEVLVKFLKNHTHLYSLDKEEAKALDGFFYRTSPGYVEKCDKVANYCPNLVPLTVCQNSGNCVSHNRIQASESMLECDNAKQIGWCVPLSQKEGTCGTDRTLYAVTLNCDRCETILTYNPRQFSFDVHRVDPICRIWSSSQLVTTTVVTHTSSAACCIYKNCSEWGVWSPCSHSCGGTRTRRRVLKPGCQDKRTIEMEGCNAKSHWPFLNQCIEGNLTATTRNVRIRTPTTMPTKATTTPRPHTTETSTTTTKVPTTTKTTTTPRHHITKTSTTTTETLPASTTSKTIRILKPPDCTAKQLNPNGMELKHSISCSGSDNMLQLCQEYSPGFVKGDCKTVAGTRSGTPVCYTCNKCLASSSGDPHTSTVDCKRHHYQGMCPTIFLQLCDPLKADAFEPISFPAGFRIVTTARQYGSIRSKVSVHNSVILETAVAKLRFKGKEIHVWDKTIRRSTEWKPIPVGVRVYPVEVGPMHFVYLRMRTKTRVSVKSNFGIGFEVHYPGYTVWSINIMNIRTPSIFSFCGLAGKFGITPNGTSVEGTNEFGNSWMLPGSKCDNTIPQGKMITGIKHCKNKKLKKKVVQICKFIKNGEVFGSCQKRSRRTAEVKKINNIYDDCLMDVCVSGGKPEAAIGMFYK